MNLKDLRKKYNLTLREIAPVAGLTLQNYALWENGKAEAQQYRLDNLVEFYKEYDKVFKQQQELMDKYKVLVLEKKLKLDIEKLNK